MRWVRAGSSCTLRNRSKRHRKDERIPQTLRSHIRVHPCRSMVQFFPAGAGRRPKALNGNSEYHQQRYLWTEPNNQRMRVGVNGRAKDISGTPAVIRVLEQIHAAGLELALTPDMATWLNKTAGSVPWKVLTEAPLEAQGLDMMISLGGDGSLLDTVAMVGRSQVPVVGINLGRLGFLSNVRLEEVDEALAVIKQGKYTLLDRSLVEVTNHEDMLVSQNFALNEVTLHKRDSASMLAVHVHLGETYLNTYWADGLIIATPTGSTAYSLSCGGPVLDPSNKALIITPISPHNLNVRPFVVPDHLTLHLQLEARSAKCLLNLDSRSHAIHGQSLVTVRKADFVVKMVQIEDGEFLPTLRAKLNWGLDIRSPKVEKNVKR